jgi:hypothetical protein
MAFLSHTPSQVGDWLDGEDVPGDRGRRERHSTGAGSGIDGCLALRLHHVEDCRQHPVGCVCCVEAVGIPLMDDPVGDLPRQPLLGGRPAVWSYRVVVVEQNREELLDWRVSTEEEPLQTRVGVEH